ncbi:ATP-binding protein [Nonomuraea insulae]|uniref:ATP-binding protein n=1 Tax=Nonomuraea insulae TaxID=1616787 RepID=A0ABW1D0U7_9ACTN
MRTQLVEFAVPKQPVIHGRHIDAMIDLSPGGLIWRRTFAGTPGQIPEARRFARYLLTDSPHQDDAELIVSELATNALRHTSSGRPGGTFIVEISRTITTATIAVYDCGWGGVPRFGIPQRTSARHRRGLAIVEATAHRTGYEGDDATGHKVWAQLQAHTSLN